MADWVPSFGESPTVAVTKVRSSEMYLNENTFSKELIGEKTKYTVKVPPSWESNGSLSNFYPSPCLTSGAC